MQLLLAATRAFLLLPLLCGVVAGRTLPLTPGILANLQLTRIGAITSILAEPDGRVIVAGDFTSIDGVPRHHIARLDADASIDVNWGVHLPGPVLTLATNESSIFVLCRITNASYGSWQGRVLKLSRVDGALDPLWQAAVGAASVTAIAVSGSNVFISGFSFVNNRQTFTMAKRSAQGVGVVDPAWNVSLEGGTASFLSVSGTNLYLTGSFDLVGGVKRGGFARVRTLGSGAVDPGWVPPAGRSYSQVQIVGDYVYAWDSLARQVLRIPVVGNGSPDPGWSTGSIASNGFLSTFHVSGTNIYLVADSATEAQVSRRSLAAPSVPDPGGGHITLDRGRPDLIHASGTNVYIAGWFDNIGGQPAFGLVRLRAELPATHVLTSFSPRIEVPGAVFALALEANGGLIVGGDFGSANGVRRCNLARIRPDGTLDLNWNPGPKFPVFHLLIHSNSLFAAGEVFALNVPGRLVKVDLVRGAMDDTWHWEPPGLKDSSFVFISALAAAGTNLFVAQAIYENDAQWGRVSRLSTEGGAADADWKLEADATIAGVPRLLTVGTNLFVGGDFSEIGSVAQNYLARVSVNSTGSVDTSFSPNPSGPIAALASDGVHLFAAGYFDHIGGLSRTNLAKLDLQSGQAVAGWDAGTNWGDEMALGGTNLYVSRVVGTDENPVMHAVRLSTLTGAMDPAWQIAPNIPFDGLRYNRLWTSSVHVIAVRSESVYVGGDFTVMSGLPRHGLAAFHPVNERRMRYPLFNSGQLEFEALAEPWRSFILESSSDFAAWSPITNLVPVSPVTRLSIPIKEDVRFYRVR